MPRPVSDSHSSRAGSLADRLRDALRLQKFPEALAHRGRWLSTRCLVEIGNESVFIQFERGEPRIIENVPLLAPWDFAIRGSEEAWSGLWEDVPRPGWHDLFALTKRGEMRVEGDLHPLLANLQFIKDVLALPRGGNSA